MICLPRVVDVVQCSTCPALAGRALSTDSQISIVLDTYHLMGVCDNTPGPSSGFSPLVFMHVVWRCTVFFSFRESKAAEAGRTGIPAATNSSDFTD